MSRCLRVSSSAAVDHNDGQDQGNDELLENGEPPAPADR
jgi:hypothetical protein